MGDPKKQRKKYATPKYPFSSVALGTELKLLGEYGLRNKREIWRHRALLTKYRLLARELLARSPEDRMRIEKQLLNKLSALKMVPENSTIDNILDLSIENVLERRLQTLVHKRGLSKTLRQARQLITHGHISIKGKKVTSPSYTVAANEESFIEYSPTSSLTKMDHPLRKELSISPKMSQ
ncbi:MAG: small subunit ribosomal protein [Thermoproteota archaeon]|nr:small subunit ribosomal protein [Thermoproteota archaeon]